MSFFNFEDNISIEIENITENISEVVQNITNNTIHEKTEQLEESGVILRKDENNLKMILKLLIRQNYTVNKLTIY